MTPLRLAGGLALAALAGAGACFLPQPLPDYPPGTITPPRILVDELQPATSVVTLVPAGCTTTAPEYPLSLRIHDTNTFEQVETRWFVNYDATNNAYTRPVQEDVIPPDPDPLVLTRAVPPAVRGPFRFRPYEYAPPAGVPPAMLHPPYDAPGVVHVVEVVVSNNFLAPKESGPLPYRNVTKGFETQAYRWVFLTVPESTGCDDPAEPGCVRCPP